MTWCFCYPKELQISSVGRRRHNQLTWLHYSVNTTYRLVSFWAISFRKTLQVTSGLKADYDGGGEGGGSGLVLSVRLLTPVHSAC